MNLKKKQQFIIKSVIGVAVLVSLLLVVSKYFSYSTTLSAWDEKEELKKAEINKIVNNIAKTKNNIKKLELEKEKMLAQGVNINKVKTNINVVLNAINKSKNLNLRLVSADYHKNFSNVLKIKLEYSKNRNKAIELKNSFEIKTLLNMTSVKKALGVYDDYEINGNSIVFYYYES